MEESVRPSVGYRPGTFTGFRELPLGRALLILLLWTPRFFIPWISALHQFDVELLSNPWHWKTREGDILKNKIYVLVASSIIAVLLAVHVDLTRRKFQADFTVFLPLSLLFTLSTMAGSWVDFLLRAGFREESQYKDWWFVSIVLMQWAMSVSFMMFPVQISCIYILNDKMSRNAHYNWTSIFVLREVINPLITFMVIPGKCPTPQWIEVVSWTEMSLTMCTVFLLTVIMLSVVKLCSWKCLLVMFRKKEANSALEEDPAPFIDVPRSVQMTKVVWFAMIVVPVIVSSFSFSILTRFAPEDWNHHDFLSALSLFHAGRITGVIVIFLVMFICRKVYRRRNSSKLKIEILYLGLPHCLFTLALLILFGRFATLSRLSEGDIIHGPAPNEGKSVLVFANVGYRNTTYCITSDRFRPLRIRPQEHAAAEIYDIPDKENVTVKMEVDPMYEPVQKKDFRVWNLQKGQLRIFMIKLHNQNYSNDDVWDFYRNLTHLELLDVQHVRPKPGPPQVLIFEVQQASPPQSQFFQMNHSEIGTVEVIGNNSYNDPQMRPIFWEPPAVGKWTVRSWDLAYNASPEVAAWVGNCSPCQSPLEFEIENHSLYLLTEFKYQEDYPELVSLSNSKKPPEHLPNFPMPPFSFLNLKLAEVAGPNSTRLPSDRQLRKDWAVRICMVLSGMAAGGIFLGFVYLFWVDSPVPRYRLISLALCWTAMGVLWEIPEFNPIDVDVKVCAVLLCVQIVMTVSHFVGGFFMFTPTYNFRIRPD